MRDNHYSNNMDYAGKHCNALCFLRGKVGCAGFNTCLAVILIFSLLSGAVHLCMLKAAELRDSYAATEAEAGYGLRAADRISVNNTEYKSEGVFNRSITEWISRETGSYSGYYQRESGFLYIFALLCIQLSYLRMRSQNNKLEFCNTLKSARVILSFIHLKDGKSYR